MQYISEFSSDEFLKRLDPGPFKDSMTAAFERQDAAIAELGEEECNRRFEQKKERILAEAFKKDQSMYAQQLLKVSGLGKKFESRKFDTFRANNTNKAALDACLALAGGKRDKGLIISGPHGIGKTHLAAAVVNRLASNGTRSRFVNFVDLKSKVMDSFRTGTDTVINNLIDCRLLALDDLGAEHSRNDSNWIEELLYKIINRMYENNGSILITTNLEEFDFLIRYGDRISSRLSEMTDWYSYDDKDRRII